jgi:hypothetical protein
MTQMGDILYDGIEKGRANVRSGNDNGAKLMLTIRSASDCFPPSRCRIASPL